jgi:peptide deformylase
LFSWAASAHFNRDDAAMKLKIVQLGEPVLRQKARQLAREEILSPNVQNLIELMRETMRDAPGVGLAAPQVGLPLQLAVIEDREDYQEGVPVEILAERGRRPVPFHVIVNPVITLGDQHVVFFEGCLSLPGYSALVPRARTVHVEALNERAESVVIDAEGWYARILQHEIDHLAGIVYVDRMKSRSLATNENLMRYWKGKTIAQVRAELGIDT